MAKRGAIPIILNRTPHTSLTSTITGPHIMPVLPLNKGTRGRVSRRGFLAALSVGAAAIATGAPARYARGLASMARHSALKLEIQDRLSVGLEWLIRRQMSKAVADDIEDMIVEGSGGYISLQLPPTSEEP